MTRLVLVFLLAIPVVSTLALPSHGQDKLQNKGFLSVLKEGQPIIAREVGGRYEIIYSDKVGASHKVLEVGTDYLVIEDVAGVIETRIPIYSIKSIVKLKLK